MNPFKLGNKVRCIRHSVSILPQFGEEFIITCVDSKWIGFESKYPVLENNFHMETREGHYPNWLFSDYELVQ